MSGTIINLKKGASKEQVERIISALERIGYDCWYADDGKGGDRLEITFDGVGAVMKDDYKGVFSTFDGVRNIT